MGERYLLDTNVVIDFSANKLPDESHKLVAQIIDKLSYISVINKIELLGFADVPAEIKAFTETAFLLAMSDDIINQTIALRKLHKIKLPDAVIAATAIEYDLTLVTRNISDFKDIDDLKLIDPYKMLA